MGLLRVAKGISELRRLSNQTNKSLLCSFGHGSIHHFSTQSGSFQQQQQPQQAQSDPNLKPPNSGLKYGRLLGISHHTLKKDVIFNYLEHPNLNPDDIKVLYNDFFSPVAYLIQFPSHSEYMEAVRNITKKRQKYRLEEIDRAVWDMTQTFDGTHVLLQGVPRAANLDDVHRFLSGCDYDSSSLESIRGNQRGPQMAIVRFPSQVEAMNAAIRKNQAFCLSNQVSVRVLH